MLWGKADAVNSHPDTRILVKVEMDTTHRRSEYPTLARPQPEVGLITPAAGAEFPCKVLPKICDPVPLTIEN